MSKQDHWNATLYDDSHRFISEYGTAVVDLLGPQKGEKILDVGCGTGDLANELAEKGAIVTGIDQSENMIQEAKEKYEHSHFEVADASHLTYKEKFDAVFSNAALHWIQTPDKVIRSVYNSLKNGGRFVAEFGAHQNIEVLLNEIINQLDVHGYDDAYERNPWYFPTISEYTTLLEKQGFDVTFAKMIERPTKLDGADGLRKWLHMFTGNFFQDINEEERNKIIKSIETALKSTLFDGENWTIHYRRIQVICYKN